jgi:hypothetical protein
MLFDLVLSQTRNKLVANKTYQELLGHLQMMHCRVGRSIFNKQGITSRVCRPTLLDLLFEAVDTSENLSSGSRSLFLYQSVQPLPGLVDVLDSKKTSQI